LPKRVARRNFDAGDVGHLAEGPGRLRMLMPVKVAAGLASVQENLEILFNCQNNNATQGIFTPNIIVHKE